MMELNVEAGSRQEMREDGRKKRSLRHALFPDYSCNIVSTSQCHPPYTLPNLELVKSLTLFHLSLSFARSSGNLGVVVPEL